MFWQYGMYKKFALLLPQKNSFVIYTLLYLRIWICSMLLSLVLISLCVDENDEFSIMSGDSYGWKV
jgi:hypothetical protein